MLHRVGVLVSRFRRSSRSPFCIAALFQQFAKKWLDAVMTARKELGLKGFCAVGGKSAQGKALYSKAKAIYAA